MRDVKRTGTGAAAAGYIEAISRRAYVTTEPSSSVTESDRDSSARAGEGKTDKKTKTIVVRMVACLVMVIQGFKTSLDWFSWDQ